MLPRTLSSVALATALLAPLPAAEPQAEDFWKASGNQGAVVTGRAEATEAGLAMLQAGGNAVDATVAALLVLSVTDSGNFCFGGEVPIMVYSAERKSVEVLAGQGAAPRLATLEHFQKRGGIPPTGIEAATVPGAFDALLVALERHGTVTFERAVEPTLRILERRSIAWAADLHRTLSEVVAAERTSPDDRRRGLRRAADHFYRGPIAQRLDAWSREHGGLLRAVDLATHVTRIEDPVSIDYRGFTVCKCGVWTQGPSLLQSLRLLDGYDLRSLGLNSADYVHTTVEALKLAFADRDVHYADPLFADVPLTELLSTKYADVRRPLIDPARASLTFRPGDPRGTKAEFAFRYPPVANTPQRDTTTCLVADRFGNVVAATPSGWGGVLAGDTGVVLGSRLRCLNTWPGQPNCVEPGKRPRITLTPTIVLRGGQPVVAISVAGGDLQDQASLQVLLNCCVFDLPAAEAITTPRFSTAHYIGSFSQTPPQLGSLTVDAALGEPTIAALKERGHLVRVSKPPFGNACLLRLDPATGRKHGAGDPLARRHAAAY